ncbi:MAG: adenylosuccinate lyase, partial [Candidatus Woesearchaeota archaeon]
VVKQEGKANDLFKRLAEDINIPVTDDFLNKLLKNPERFAGAAEQQTEEFLNTKVKPLLEKYSEFIGDSDS